MKKYVPIVTDDPQDNVEAALNLVFVKNEEVYVRGYADALKLDMLTFYFATSGVYAEPVIEDHLAKQVCRIVWETGLTLHEREELFLDTIRDDTLPEHIMSAKDCAYIFDVCAAGRVEDAREMLGRFVTAQAAK